MNSHENISCLITCVGCSPAASIVKSLKKSKKYNFNLIGIDIQNITVGNFICDIYKQSPLINDEIKYWSFIKSLINEYNIKYVFVTHHLEVESWALNKINLEKEFNIKILHNDYKFVNIMNSKINTYNFCLEHNIRVPTVYKHVDIVSNNVKYPILIKDNKGAGSTNIKIFNNKDEYITYFNSNTINNNNVLIQQFIKGDEYTVDCLSNENTDVLCVIPKKRLVIRNGAAFLSQIENNKSIVDYVTFLLKKSQNKYSVNVQVIVENKTNNIYLIEVNPKWATSFPLSVEAGLNLPEILIELQENPNIYRDKQLYFKDKLIMLRHFTEYFM